jgi:hypothetical protein
MLSRMERELRRKRPAWRSLFFLFVFLPLLTVFPYIRAVNNPNEFSRVFTVMSLVEAGSFRIDEQVATFGWVNDLAHVPGNEDKVPHYYMVKGPGCIYPALPGYFVFSKVIAPLMGKHYPGIWGGHWKPEPGKEPIASTLDEKNWWLEMATWAMRISASNIPCFLFLLWFERYLRAFTSDASIRYAAVTACGLGTNYLAYTHMYASHSQYAAVAFMAFAFIEREMRESRGDILKMRPSRALLAGFFTSAAVTLEYHALFMCVLITVFGVLVFWRPFSTFARLVGLRRWIPLGTSLNPTRLLAFAAGGLSNVPHMMYFHWTAFGNPLTPGHQKIENPNFLAKHHQGLWGILWPTWDHVKALAIDPSFGFFGMSPYMWLGLLSVPLILISPYGPPSFRRYLRIGSVAWILFMVMAFGVNAGFVEWRAGWTVGPRYLVVCAPFFAFGAALMLERFAHHNRSRRAMARGMGGGLALAGVLAIGTVGLVYDTLPENIPPPFAHFAVPMMRLGLVPHHLGEWFGWSSTTLWYIACAALVAAPFVATFAPQRDDKRSDKALRTVAFLAAAACGLVPQLAPPLREDGTQAASRPDQPLFVLDASMAGVGLAMEPAGRDRLTKYREEAESLGLRGRGPCVWYRLASLERTAGQDAKANRDEAKAKSALPKERCSKWWF